MIALGLTCNISEKKKAKGSKKFAALQETFEVLGRSHSPAKGNALCWSPPPSLPQVLLNRNLLLALAKWRSSVSR